MAGGTVQDAGAAFGALVVNHYFLAVTHGLHFHVAAGAKKSSTARLHKA